MNGKRARLRQADPRWEGQAPRRGGVLVVLDEARPPPLALVHALDRAARRGRRLTVALAEGDSLDRDRYVDRVGLWHAERVTLDPADADAIRGEVRRGGHTTVILSRDDPAAELRSMGIDVVVLPGVARGSWARRVTSPGHTAEASAAAAVAVRTR